MHLQREKIKSRKFHYKIKLLIHYIIIFLGCNSVSLENPIHYRKSAELVELPSFNILKRILSKYYNQNVLYKTD